MKKKLTPDQLEDLAAYFLGLAAGLIYLAKKAKASGR